MTRTLPFVIIPWACAPRREPAVWGEFISLRVTILGSGSSGNCTLLETDRTRLLVDAGFGKKETLRRLELLNLAPGSVDGIVISHEHTDHIGSLAQVLGQWRATVYLNEATHSEVLRILPETSHKRLERVEHIRAGQRFVVGDIEVSPFAIPHDAVDPLGFTFRTNGTKVAIVTDLGYLPELVKVHLRDSDCLMLESNHDLEMLKVGPYPWHIKQRVMSRTGHLSNTTTSEFLADIDAFDGRARYVVLAHLSETNNNPYTAEMFAKEALDRRADFTGELIVASQSSPLPTLNL